MKYIWMTIVLLALAVPALAEDFIVTNSEYIVVSGSTSDTLGRTPLVPDSIHIFICDSAQTTLHDAAYTSSDDQASLDGEHMKFSDQWNDLNGGAEVGVFHMTVTVWSDADNNIDVSSEREYTIRGVTVSVNQTFNEVGFIYDSLPDNFKDMAITDVTGEVDAKLDLAGDVSNALADGSIDNDALGQVPPTNWDDMAIEGTTGIVESNVEDWNTVAVSNLDDETIGTVTDVTNAVTATNMDSVITAIADANKGNFKATGFSTHAATDIVSSGAITTSSGAVTTVTNVTNAVTATNMDSVVTAIADANKGNFKATGFSTHSAADAADAVWDEDTTGHTAGAKFGQAVKAIHDTAHAQDGWVAKEASLFSGNLNLDNATGSLSDAQVDDITVTAGTVSDKADYNIATIDADAITASAIQNAAIDAATYAAGAINDAAIADDAIDYATFAATAPGAWWNEDKTGYTVSTVSDKTGYALTAAQHGIAADSVWATDSAQVDASDLGVWLVNNLSGAAGGLDTLTDTYAAKLVDLVWNEELATHTINGSVGEVLLDSLDDKLSDIGSGSVTDADMIAIADTIFGRDSSDVNAGAATSYGTLMMKPAYVQGAASGLDSAAVNRIIGRTMWSDATATDSAIVWATTTQRDSVLAAVGRNDNIQTATDSTATAIADANKANFKATGFSTHSAANVWSVGTRALTDKSDFALTDAQLAAIADSVWDEILTGGTHNIATSAGRRLRNAEAGVILTEGTAQSGSDTGIIIDAGESATNDIYNHALMVITGGTGAGQSHSIRDYVGSSKLAVIAPNWRINPDNTSTYTIHAFGEVDVYQVETGGITASSFAADAITASALAGSAADEIRDTVYNDVADYRATGFSTHSFLDVWNTGFGTGFNAGSMGDSLNNASYVSVTDTNTSGEELAVMPDYFSAADSAAYQGAAGSAASIADAVWNEDTTGHYTAGLYGYEALQGGGGGTGPNAMTFFFIDTTTGDVDTVNGAHFSVFNAGGSRLASLVSASDGSQSYNCPSGDIRVVADKSPTYLFGDTTYTTADKDTVDVYGYEVTQDSPANADYASVYNTERDIDGSDLVGAIISINRQPRGIAANAGDNFAISTRVIKDTSDASGYWSLDVMRTGQYTDTTVGFYHIECWYGSDQLWYYDSLYVPAAGNINMADEL